MSTIAVDVYAFNIVAMDVAACVVAAVYDEAFLALLCGLVGEDAAEETGADNEVIVHNILELL